MTVTTELPLWLPYFNLIVRLAIFIAASQLLWFAWRGNAPDRLVRIIICSAFWVMAAILVGGALSQAGLLSIDVWILIGSGGSVIVLIILLTLLVSRDRL